MTPMFVETQSSQSPESFAASQSGAMKGKLRATQTLLEFSQTQTEGTIVIQCLGRGTEDINMVHRYIYHGFLYPPGRRTTYNWLTGSSVDTLADYTPGSESLSSLLVFDKKPERRIPARRPVGEGFGLRRLTASTDEVDGRTQGWCRRRSNLCGGNQNSRTEKMFVFVYFSIGTWFRVDRV